MGLCQIPLQTMEWFQRPLSLEGRMTTHNWLKWVLPLLTADVMQQERPWSSPLQWQLSSRLPLPSLGQRPLLTDVPFPKALSNCGRKKLKVKTLSILLKTAYLEGKDDADWDFGEASPIPISAPTSLQDFRKALLPRFPICAMSVRACSIWMQCYDDKYRGDCCDWLLWWREGEGQTFASDTLHHKMILPRENELFFSGFPRLWMQGWWGRNLLLVPRSKLLLLSALKGSMWGLRNWVVWFMKKIAKWENWQLNVYNVLPVLVKILSSASVTQWSRVEDSSLGEDSSAQIKTTES